MKILLVSPVEPPIGGIATWTKLYLKEMKKHQNIKLDVLNTAFIGKNVSSMKMTSIPDEMLRTTRLIKKSFSYGLKEYDIIHFNLSGDNIGVIRDAFMIFLLRRKGNRIISHFHCDLTKMTSSNISKIIVKWIVKIANKTIVIEKNSEKWLSNICKVKAIKVANFIDFDDVSLHKKQVVSDSVKSIAFAGHIKYEKGIDDIIKISEKNQDIIFNLYGLIDERYKSLDRINIKLHGPLQHDVVMKEIAKADVILFPSHSEGFSLSLLEGMALKLPIIATDVGVARDLLIGKQSEFVFRISDYEAMSDAICKMKEKSIRQELGQLNLVTAENYTSKLIVSKLIEIYEDVISYD